MVIDPTIFAVLVSSSFVIRYSLLNSLLIPDSCLLTPVIEGSGQPVVNFRCSETKNTTKHYKQKKLEISED